MSFLAKTDKFGIADAAHIVCTSVEDGISASVAEASDEGGSVVASEVYGQVASPSCTYEIKASLASDAKDIVLGGVTTVESKNYCLTEVALGTSAGASPTLSAKGEEVPSATAESTYTVSGGLAITNRAAAQIILSAFTLAGTGCHVTDCSATFKCDTSFATKDGERLAWDVSNGRIEVSATINQTGETAPTVTADDGWIITSPLTCSNPDSDFPTHTVTLTKYLAKDA